jgi:hypothetical protein
VQPGDAVFGLASDLGVFPLKAHPRLGGFARMVLALGR